MTKKDDEKIEEYKSLDELKENEVQGIDWDKYCRDAARPILVLAPHGGTIEPHTELIAERIAGNDFKLFVFMGLRREKKIKDRKWLHVTSSDAKNYKDDDLIRLQKGAIVAISIHGGKDRDQIGNYKKLATFMGGNNEELMELVWNNLDSYGFYCHGAPASINGKSNTNIVNQCSKGGVQLEISRSERDSLANNPVRLERYTKAIRETLLQYIRTLEDSGKSKKE